MFATVLHNAAKAGPSPVNILETFLQGLKDLTTDSEKLTWLLHYGERLNAEIAQMFAKRCNTKNCESSVKSAGNEESRRPPGSKNAQAERPTCNIPPTFTPSLRSGPFSLAR